MYITSDIFLKYYKYLDLNDKQDIFQAGLCNAATTNNTGLCSDCAFSDKGYEITGYCMTGYNRNLDLRTSIKDFKKIHPELFI